MIPAYDDGSEVLRGNGTTYSVISYPSSQLPDSYIPLVFARWLRSFRFGNPFIKKADSHSYYKHYHQYIENLMAKPDSIVRLAVLSDDHDVVLGFSVSREDVLDYVHVQVDHRKQGIAKKLIPKGTTTITHTTNLAVGILKNNANYNFTFNPFA